jgi:hypothetical protein
MAEQPFLHVDDDWKKQAQEEKRRLAEQEQERAAKAPAAAPVATAPVASAAAAAAAAAPAASASARARGGREAPQANFAAIVQSLWTQAMLYLGELAPSGSEPMLNLDMARYQFDLLGILETKTKGNLNEEEQRLLDAALYETSSRFINVASQFL